MAKSIFEGRPGLQRDLYTLFLALRIWRRREGQLVIFSRDYWAIKNARKIVVSADGSGVVATTGCDLP
jgi:hypothetical protein